MRTFAEDPSGEIGFHGSEPVTDDPRRLRWLGEVHGVPASGDEGCDAVRRQPSDPQGMDGEARIVGSRHGKHGGAEGTETVPQGLLGAGAAQSEARGESGRGVAASLGDVRSLPGQVVEHGTAEPAFQEVLDVAGSLEGVRLGHVAQAPALALRRILDPSGGAEQDHASDRQIRVAGDVQRDTCPERVAEHVARRLADAGPHGIRHEPGRVVKSRAHGVGPAVPREVNRHQQVGLGQLLAEAAEEPAGLREAVQEDQWCSRAPHLGMEWHVG